MGCTDQDETGGENRKGKRRNHMRGYRPMTVREIGERGNGTRSRCCIANAEQLWNLKRKAYEIEMETSGLKDRWRSEMDQRQER